MQIQPIKEIISGVTQDAFVRIYFKDKNMHEALCSKAHLNRLKYNYVDTSATSFDRYADVELESKLSWAVRHVLGTDRIAYQDHVHFDTSTMSGTWDIVLGDSLKSWRDNVKAHGTFRVTVPPALSAASSEEVELCMDGSVDVDTFGGGMMESLLQDKLKEGFQETMSYVKEWVAKHPVESHQG